MASPAPASPALDSLIAPFRPAIDIVRALLAQPAIRRTLPAAGLLAVVLVAAAGWMLLRQPAMVALYPGLAEVEKAQAVQILSAAGMRPAVDAASGTLTIPEADYRRARMALAEQGIPAAAPDAESVLDRIQLGASRPVEAMRLKQAQEAALAASVQSIGGVAAARVHLAIPERSAFLRDTQPPGASVVVTLHPGVVLAPGQVEAIVNLVASSVAGLSREAVSVIDQRGRLLSQPGGDGTTALASRQLQTRRQMEDLYRSRIEAMLTPLTGAGNLSVQVTLEMDFTSSEIHSDAVIPDASALRSEELQSSDTTAGQARGIPGQVSNTPPAAPDLGAAAEGDAAAGGGAAPGPKTSTAASKRNYDVGRRVEITRPGAPRVDRISVAVLVRAPADPATPLPLADLERLVKGAIGFDADRGDAVTLLAQPFVDPDLPPLAGDAAAAPGWRVYAGVALLGVAGLLVVGVLVALLLRARRRPAPPRPYAAATGDPARPGALGELPVGATPAALPGPTAADQALRDERRLALARAAMTSESRDEKYAILRTLAEEDPARIAAVLRKMMKDEIDRVM